MKHAARAHLYNLVAFLCVLAAIVTLALAGKATDLAIMTGLVGVLGSFRPWGASAPADETNVRVVNPPSDPVPVEPGGGP